MSLPLAMAAPADAAEPERYSMGRDQPFDLGWRFYRGEGAFEATDVDDAAWRMVDLPHDFSIEDLPGPATLTRFGPFAKDAVGGTGVGFTVGGEGWYRKRLAAAALPRGARVELAFDGVAVIADIWVNGQAAASHFHAYTPFAVDITPYLVAAGENVIVVRARNVGRNSRWYSGSGIYRSVTLDVMPTEARLARWGVAASTRSIVDDRAVLEVSTRVEGKGEGLTLRNALRDTDGRLVAQEGVAVSGEVRQSLSVPAARLWSPADPHLYMLETALLRGGVVIDRITQPVGLRIVTMDATNGVRVNGNHVVLRGGCVHHDNGLLGAATFAVADERRVLLHKARGFNAFRSSHNPASKAFLDACDRHGMLVINEAFDSWHIAKRPDDHTTYFKQHWRQDLAEMVGSSRNHPSIVMWSIGNEITERSVGEGLQWSWNLANEVRRLDPTRPVTAGLQEFLGRPMRAAEWTARAGQAGRLDQPSTIFLDVAGYNYKLGDIETDHLTYPDRVIFASETYAHDAYDYWALVQRAPYFLGEFVWTSMDYIGEAGVGVTVRAPVEAPAYGHISFPIYNAFSGDIDLIGTQKPQSLYRDVVWGLSKLEIAVRRPLPPGQDEKIPLWGWSDELQSWTWHGAEGIPLAVRMYTSGDRLDIRLNGKVVGSKAVGPADKMKAEFMLAYQAGLLEVVAYQGNREIARRQLTTAGEAAKLRLRAEPPSGRGRQALCFVNVEVLDGSGRLVPDAIHKLSLTVDGPAELAGFGSANPRAVGSFQARQAQTFQGRALAVLRATGKGGAVRVEVRGDGLKGNATRLRLG